MTEHGINRLWYEPRWAWLAWLLAPLAAIFAIVSVARRWCYRRGLLRSAHPGAPVIVVGNLTVGGTGKTPVTVWLARELALRGRRVGIIARGYGGQQRDAARLPPDADPAHFGDEPVLIQALTGLPVAVGERRLDAARLLVREAGVDVLVSDDGLQHYALMRDVEVAVIDGQRGLGNGWLLPAGPLRETAARLQTVDAVVFRDGRPHRPLVTGPDVTLLDMRIEITQVRALLAASGELTELAAWRGRRVHAVAGIAAPGRFFDALRGAGLEVLEHPGGDHAAWTPAELTFADDLPVLMTAKDAVKCRSFARAGWYCVDARASFDAATSERWLSSVMARIAAPV